MRIYFLLLLTIFIYTKVYSQPLDDGDITWNFVGKSGGFMLMGYNNILSEFIEKRQRPLPDSFVINYHTSLKDDSTQDISNPKYPYEKTFEFNKHLDIKLYYKKGKNFYMRELRYFAPNSTHDYLVREHYYYKQAIPEKFGIGHTYYYLVDSILIEIFEISRFTKMYENIEVKKINFFYTNLDPSPNKHRFYYNEKGVAFYKEPLLNAPVVVSSVRVSTLSFSGVYEKYGIFNYDNGRSEISKDSTFSLLKYLTNEESFKDEIYNYYLSKNTPGIGDGRIYLNDPFHAWPNYETKTGEREFGGPLTSFFPSSRSIFSVTYPKPYKGFGSNYKITHTSLIENESSASNLYQSKKISEYRVGDDKLISLVNSFCYDGLDIKKATNKQLSTFTYLSKYSVLENLTVIDNSKKYKYKIIYKISY